MKSATLIFCALAALMPVFCWIDRAGYGPHSLGISYIFAMLLAIFAVILILYALFRRKWLLLIGGAAIIFSAFFCDMITASWTYCPECRAMLPNVYLL